MLASVEGRGNFMEETKWFVEEVDKILSIFDDVNLDLFSEEIKEKDFPGLFEVLYILFIMFQYRNCKTSDEITNILASHVAILKSSDIFKDVIKLMQEVQTKYIFEKYFAVIDVIEYFFSFLNMYITLRSCRRSGAELAAEMRNLWKFSDEEIISNIIETCKNSLMIPAENEDILKQFILAKEGITILPQRILPFPDTSGSKIQIPQRLYDYVYAFGGRMMQQSIGYISNFVTVLESEIVIGNEFGIKDIKINKTQAEIGLYIIENNGEMLESRYIFSFDTAAHLYNLILILYKKHIRFDILSLEGSEKLGIKKSICLDIPSEFLDKLKPQILNILQDKFNNNPNNFRLAMLSEMFSNSTEPRFLSCEAQKSEVFMNPYIQLIKDKTHIPEINEYMEADRQLLKYRHMRAKYLFKHQLKKAAIFEDKINEMSKTAIKKLEYARNKCDYPTSKDEEILLEIANVLADNRRCLLHLNYAGKSFEAYWLKPSNDKYKIGRINLSTLNKAELEKLFDKWVGSKEPKRTRLFDNLMNYLGKNFAKPVKDALINEGIKNIVISPVLFLDAVPLHCAIIEDDRFFMDYFDSISYVSSGILLSDLYKKGKVSLKTFLGAHDNGENLEFPSEEIKIINACFKQLENSLRKDFSVKEILENAKDANLVHLSCHSNPYFTNFWEQGLCYKNELLSVAQAVRDGSFENSGLVNLSACSTGKGNGFVSGLRNYAGIDGVFLNKGARSVISTFWAVDDFISLLFNAIFYVELGISNNVQEAYNKAIMTFRNNDFEEGTICKASVYMLNKFCPDWKERIKKRKLLLSSPSVWSIFKCSGWTWDCLEK